MTYVIKVAVQLPDGTITYRPVARHVRKSNGELEFEVVKLPWKEACDWAEHILPDKTKIQRA